MMLIHLQTSRELNGCYRKNEAWKQIMDFAEYSKIIPQVDTIRILEQNNHHFRLEWFVTVDGAPFSWVEIAVPCQENYLLQSEAVNGDFDTLKGEWKIEDNNQKGIRLSYSLDYELGIPVIEENCRNILMSKMQKYIETMVEKQCSVIEKKSSEQRRFRRIILNRPYSINIDGRKVETTVLNASRGGMRINLSRGMIGTDHERNRELKIENVTFKGRILFDPYCRTHRVIFNKPLEESAFDSLFARWENGLQVSEEMVKIYEVMTAQPKTVPRECSKKSPC